MNKKALILVDIQNDFLPGGSLAVPKGDEILPVVNALIASNKYDVIVSTQDWHPANHGSFVSQHKDKSPFEVVNLFGLQQVLWPDHCVQNTFGSEFSKDLLDVAIDKVFRKGTDTTVDSYSGFFDNDYRNATGMGDWLRIKRVSEVTIVGLATDYCVKFTAMDAKKLGFKTTVLKAACRGVNINSDDSDKAFNEMINFGISVV